jgi:hypothetical protein
MERKIGLSSRRAFRRLPPPGIPVHRVGGMLEQMGLFSCCRRFRKEPVERVESVIIFLLIETAE